MDVTYYFPWGYFYPVRTGAMAVAARHLEYFRSRGIRPRIVVLADETAPERRLFEKHYHWAREISVIGVQYYPEIRPYFNQWSFSGYLAGHAAIARVPELRRAFAQPTDVVMLNYVFASTLLDACTSARWRVLEAHDILSRQFLFPGSSPAAIQHQLKTEFELYKMYDLVIMLNEEEAQLARQRSSARIEYASRAVDVVNEFEAFGQTAETKYDLLFVGCQFRPNLEGIRWFYEHVFRPFLKPQGVTLALAGNVSLAADIHDPAVKLLGPVDDLKQTYREAKIVVVPLFEGSGLSIKTLEAMGAGKPVVATPCGRRGLSDCDDCLVCLPFEAAPSEVAARIASLCRSSIDRESLGRRALEYIKRRFSAEAYGERMDRLLGDLPSATSHVAA